MKYTELSPKPNFSEIQPETLGFWMENKVFERSVEDRKDEEIVFYDGPPFPTGKPHHGTVLVSFIKDMIARYWTMRGYQVPRVWGWDCHGLPAESAIIKQTKLDRGSMSVSDFRNKCKDFVLSYVDIQREGFKRLGVVGDWDNPYLTLKPFFAISPKTSICLASNSGLRVR